MKLDMKPGERLAMIKGKYTKCPNCSSSRYNELIVIGSFDYFKQCSKCDHVTGAGLVKWHP